MAADWHMKVPEIANAVRRRTTPVALGERRLLLETRFNAGCVVTLRDGRTVLIAVGDEDEKGTLPELGTMRLLFIADPLAPEKEWGAVHNHPTLHTRCHRPCISMQTSPLLPPMGNLISKTHRGLLSPEHCPCYPCELGNSQGCCSAATALSWVNGERSR